MGWGCPTCCAGGGGGGSDPDIYGSKLSPRRADHFDYTYVGEHFFVKKNFPGQNLCSGAFGNIRPYTKQRARHRSPFLERPPPPPSPGAHAIPPPPPQSHFRAAQLEGSPGALSTSPALKTYPGWLLGCSAAAPLVLGAC